MYFLSYWPFVSKWPNTYIDKTATYFIEYFVIVGNVSFLFFFGWTKTGVYYFVTKAKVFVHKACPFRLWQVVGVTEKKSQFAAVKEAETTSDIVSCLPIIFSSDLTGTQQKYVARRHTLSVQLCELRETPTTEQQPHNPVVLCWIARFVNAVSKLRCYC